MDSRSTAGTGGPVVAGVVDATPESYLLEIVRGREAFLPLKKAWDEALAAGPDPSPALEHDFLRLWLEHFSQGREPMAVVARRRGRIAAALGLLPGVGRVDGVPVRRLDGWANSHSTRGGLLLGPDGLQAVGPLVAHVLEQGWDVLQLRDVPRDRGVLDALEKALRDGGCATALDLPMDSPFVPLPAAREELDRRLDARFRQNVRRRRRRLEEHGKVEFEIVTGGEGLDAALQDAYAIEAAGWKGKEGTAIRARPDTLGFYTAWARKLARESRLRLAFLSVDGKRIAFQYAFVAGGRWYLPKTGYDPAWHECSPGQLLMSEVLGRCIEERLEAFEFLGHAMTWKRDWTPLVRPHAALWAFRPTVAGRLAWLVRTQARPRAAKALRLVQAGARRVTTAFKAAAPKPGAAPAPGSAK